MMRLRHGNPARLATLVALVTIALWVGAGSLHEHPGDPGCQVCKLLHNGAADVVNPTALPAVDSVGEPLFAATEAPVVVASAPTPPERAPPLP